MLRLPQTTLAGEGYNVTRIGYNKRVFGWDINSRWARHRLKTSASSVKDAAPSSGPVVMETQIPAALPSLTESSSARKVE